MGSYASNIKLPNYRTTWHGLHLLLTLATCGVWSIVWFAKWTSNSAYNRKLDRQYQRDVLNALRRNGD